MTPETLFRKEYVSYSRLAAYQQCPQRFKLHYLDGLPCPAGRAAQLGTVVHAIIADYMRQVQKNPSRPAPDLGELSERIPPTCEQLIAQGEVDIAPKQQELLPFLRNFLSMTPLLKEAGITGIEKEHTFTIGQYRCKAILDLVLKGAKDRYTIIDFKTGKPRYVSEFQLRFYALPYLTSTRVSQLHGAFAFLRTGEFAARDLNKSVLRSTSLEILRRIEEIESDTEFHGRPSPLCRYCGVRDHCQWAG